MRAFIIIAAYKSKALRVLRNLAPSSFVSNLHVLKRGVIYGTAVVGRQN
jgi:hypothetical protein